MRCWLGFSKVLAECRLMARAWAEFIAGTTTPSADDDSSVHNVDILEWLQACLEILISFNSCEIGPLLVEAKQRADLGIKAHGVLKSTAALTNDTIVDCVAQLSAIWYDNQRVNNSLVGLEYAVVCKYDTIVGFAQKVPKPAGLRRCHLEVHR